jgi:rod shape-determining protein MreC
MAYSAGSGTPLFGEGSAGTLKLLTYLVLSVGLMLADHRGGHLVEFRSWMGLLGEPMFWLASAPARLARGTHDAVASRLHLVAERDQLGEELLVARARLARLEAVQRENESLRQLLNGTRGLSLSVQLADIADVELDPFRHRVFLDIGARHGVREGLAIIDAEGVFGQIVAVTPLRATALLLSDPSHAVPVQVKRSGLRTIAYGTGERDRLTVSNIPQSGDIRVGDLLLTSGIGGRFPAGLPVAVVTRVGPEDTHLFVEADATPLAALDRSGQVLLVWDDPDAGAIDVGPPEPPELRPAAGASP